MEFDNLKELREFVSRAGKTDLLRMPIHYLKAARDNDLLSPQQLVWMAEWERSVKPVSRDNANTITVDDEVLAVVVSYATINDITIAEALRRMVLNANSDEAAASDGLEIDEVTGEPF